MLRNGYDPRLACGVITASGSLAQVVPPSLVLIVMADQLGRSVGDMYAGALLPAALLIGLYAAVVGLVAVLRPRCGAGPAGRGAHLQRSRTAQRPPLAAGPAAAQHGGRLGTAAGLPVVAARDRARLRAARRRAW